MQNHKLPLILVLGTVLALCCNTVAQAEPKPDNDVLAQAYNPQTTLDASTTTKVSNMLVLIPDGRIEIHEADFCKLDVYFNSTDSQHGMLVGDMTLTLDSLPPDSEDQFNLFDAMNPGEDVVLHPKELYFHVGKRSGFHVENVGYIQSYREWTELTDELQSHFTWLYMNSLQDGWWNNEPDEELPRAGFEPISLLNTKFGGLATPEEDDWYIRLVDRAGEIWKLDTEYEDLTIQRGDFHSLKFFGHPPSLPRPFLRPNEKNYQLKNFEYMVEIKEPESSTVTESKFGQYETLTYNLIVKEACGYVNLDKTLFRTILSVDDGAGNPLRWEEYSPIPGRLQLRVDGPFVPGQDYTIVVSRKTMDYFNTFAVENIHKFVFTPSVSGYHKNPPLTIKVRMPQGAGYEFVAADGADVLGTATEFTASWPAGSLSHGVIAHTLALGTYQTENYRIEYIVEPSLQDSPKVRKSVAGFGAWLDFTAALQGKLPVDKWVVVIDADSATEDVHNPVDTELKPVDTLFPRYRIWHFTNEILEIGQSWFYHEPEFWHDAVVDYKYFAALRAFDDLLESPKAQKQRESEYSLHFYRYFPGTADELIDWRMERYLGYRITAALLAIDHEAPELLRESIIKHLFTRGLTEGKLSFEEISQTFLALEDTPASYWWQTVVLNGELPDNEFAKENYPLPGMTIPRLEMLISKNYFRKAQRGQLSGSPYSARFFYLLLKDEDVSPKMTYWKAENHYMFGEYNHALRLLDIADSAYAKPERAANRYVLRPLCLIELGREAEALAAVEYGLEAIGGVDYLEDFASALLQIQAQLAAE